LFIVMLKQQVFCIRKEDRGGARHSMAGRLLSLTSILSLIIAAGGEPVFSQKTLSPPFFDARKNQSAYNGPGREDAEPTGLTEVRIGYFGPCDADHPDGGDIWLAVNLAIDEANAEGGYRGIPFRLIQAWSESPWSNGAGLVVRMAYVDKVWAIIGGIDGASTHLAETVVAKARVTLISPASTDKTVNLANVPWMFSSLPGDDLLAPALGQKLMDCVGSDRFVVVAANDHDSHQFARELERYLSAISRPPAFRFVFESRTMPEYLSRRIVQAQPSAVVVVANARESAAIVRSLRQEGFSGKVFGGPAMGRRCFRKAVSDTAGILFPCPAPSGIDDFSRIFAKRFGFYPDYAARYGYETTRLLVAAVRRAGLNRALICDTVRDLSPWSGSAAAIEWNNLGQNRLLTSAVPICTMSTGQDPLLNTPNLPKGRTDGDDKKLHQK
jgi:branched-chain amino acid transport system substrate-binding protein